MKTIIFGIVIMMVMSTMTLAQSNPGKNKDDVFLSKSCQISDETILDIKRTSTYLVLPDSIDRDKLMEIVQPVWSVTPLKCISFTEYVSKYKDAPNSSFILVEGMLYHTYENKALKGGANQGSGSKVMRKAVLYMALSYQRQQQKVYLSREYLIDRYAPILSSSFYTLGSLTFSNNLSKKKNALDLKKYSLEKVNSGKSFKKEYLFSMYDTSSIQRMSLLYSPSLIPNYLSLDMKIDWSPLRIRLLLAEIQQQLVQKERPQRHESLRNRAKFSGLKNDTLFVLKRDLIKEKGLLKTEKVSVNIQKTFKKYTYPYQVISSNELDEKRKQKRTIYFADYNPEIGSFSIYYSGYGLVYRSFLIGKNLWITSSSIAKVAKSLKK